MAEYQRQKTIVGPDGRPLTIADLPPSYQRRWTPLRKAKVVVAVQGGLISTEEVIRRYKLTTEEFIGWRKALEIGGIDALRITRIKRQ